MNIVVIGSINADLVINTERMPKIGETISGQGFSVNCGGKGVNQAVAAAKLGGEVSFIGAVGNDENGAVSIRNLRENGINTDGVAITDTNTGVAVITVVGGDNCIILDAGANACVTREVIDKNREVITSADIVIMQLEIPLDTVAYAAKMAHDAGVKVVLNPAPVTKLPQELLENTDVIIANETETEFLTGIYPDSADSGRKCLEELKKLGAEHAIVTLGGDGSVYTNGDDISQQSAYKTNVVDTTAAGDTFIGAFCMKMNEGMKTAVRYATAASSITVSRKGASKSIPTAEEVERIV